MIRIQSSFHLVIFSTFQAPCQLAHSDVEPLHLIYLLATNDTLPKTAVESTVGVPAFILKDLRTPTARRCMHARHAYGVNLLLLAYLASEVHLKVF